MDPVIRDALWRAGEIFGVAVSDISDELRAGELGDEDDISSQILARIKAVASRIEGPISWRANIGTAPSVILKARRLTSRGKGSEESRIGADIVFTLDIDVPGYKAKKGLFIQAKCVGSDREAKSRAERERLVSQCEDMLDVTPASFVWTYGEGVFVYSANAIVSAGGVFSDIPVTWNMDIFFRDFMICWIGDSRIDSVTRPSLQDLMRRAGANHGIALEGRAPDLQVDNWGRD